MTSITAVRWIIKGTESWLQFILRCLFSGAWWWGNDLSLLRTLRHMTVEYTPAEVEPWFVVLKKASPQQHQLWAERWGYLTCGTSEGETNLPHTRLLSLSPSLSLRLVCFSLFLILSLFIFLSSPPRPPTDSNSSVAMHTMALCHCIR